MTEFTGDCPECGKEEKIKSIHFSGLVNSLRLIIEFECGEIVYLDVDVST